MASNSPVELPPELDDARRHHAGGARRASRRTQRAQSIVADHVGDGFLRHTIQELFLIGTGGAPILRRAQLEPQLAACRGGPGQIANGHARPCVFERAGADERLANDVTAGRSPATFLPVSSPALGSAVVRAPVYLPGGALQFRMTVNAGRVGCSTMVLTRNRWPSAVTT